MVDIFYNSRRYKNSLKYLLEKFESPFDFYYEISVYAKNNGYFERKISAEEWFDVIYKFYKEKGYKDYGKFILDLRRDHFENFGNKRRRGLEIFE